MKKVEPDHLSNLMTHLASDVVAVQKNMDTQFEEDRRIFSRLLADTPEEFRPYLLPLAPHRQRVSTMEYDTRVQLQRGKTVGGSIGIGVFLLNVSADLRFQRDTSQDSQLRFFVEQIPVQP